MDKKILQAQKILEAFGLPIAQQNKISALTLLALGGVTPATPWENATAKSYTLSKEIIEFVNKYYNADYKPNTRESFRKNALKPFIKNNIALLNPNEPDLSTTSSKTHYSLSQPALRCLKAYETKNWKKSLLDFRRDQFPQNKPSRTLLRNLNIKNFKSISEDSIELGRFNVFIGTNGSGKSNILEAIATAGSSAANDLNFEGLYSRGVRIARPDLTISSFASTAQKETVDFELKFETETGNEHSKISLYPENPTDIYTEWRDKNKLENEEKIQEIIKEYLELKYNNNDKPLNAEEVLEGINEQLKQKKVPKKNKSFSPYLTEFSIYDLNTKSLRGVVPADSRKTPLGINGEGLDLLISNFNSYEKSYLNNCRSFFDWLESIESDKEDKSKLKGLKPGRSSSTLFFKDKFMQKQNNTFSAENSNEGILHIIFYIALFISNKTPNFFAIDNIETALNPRLCQKLISLLTSLAKERGKQAIVTTHNPAILDGLNLFDDDQRLFEVYRDSEGKTRTRRIKFKKNLEDKKFKLSEMWLKGLLGAVPQNF